MQKIGSSRPIPEGNKGDLTNKDKTRKQSWVALNREEEWEAAAKNYADKINDEVLDSKEKGEEVRKLLFGSEEGSDISIQDIMRNDFFSQTFESPIFKGWLRSSDKVAVITNVLQRMGRVSEICAEEIVELYRPEVREFTRRRGKPFSLEFSSNRNKIIEVDNYNRKLFSGFVERLGKKTPGELTADEKAIISVSKKLEELRVKREKEIVVLEDEITTHTLSFYYSPEGLMHALGNVVSISVDAFLTLIGRPRKTSENTRTASSSSNISEPEVFPDLGKSDFEDEEESGSEPSKEEIQATKNHASESAKKIESFCRSAILLDIERQFSEDRDWADNLGRLKQKTKVFIDFIKPVLESKNRTIMMILRDEKGGRELLADIIKVLRTNGTTRQSFVIHAPHLEQITFNNYQTNNFGMPTSRNFVNMNEALTERARVQSFDNPRGAFSRESFSAQKKQTKEQYILPPKGSNK